MCSRNRSRPSSKRRLTKKLNRFSSSISDFASAIGVVDEHKLRTNGPASAPIGAACSRASARSATADADLGVDVIDPSPDDTYP
jgi:hypothetical protein